MFNRILKKYFPLLLLLLLALSFQSCKTTNSLVKESIQPSAPADAQIVLAPNVEFQEIEGDYKYLFIRLYNPVYNSPVYIANILKNGLAATKTEDVPDLSHSAINFNLNDTFYGLTLGGKYNFAEENCLTVEGHKYMKHCNPEKSEQITYALKVTEEEYNNTQKFVDHYLKSTKVKYASGLNVKLALFSIKKKFFTSKEHKQFSTQKYPKSAKNVKIDQDDEKSYLNRFVCSTFIGYVLYNNVESVAEFFDKYNIKYDYLNVTDLSLIPGMTPLFYSTWSNYLEAAKEFVNENEEFAEYLTQ